MNRQHHLVSPLTSGRSPSSHTHLTSVIFYLSGLIICLYVLLSEWTLSWALEAIQHRLRFA